MPSAGDAAGPTPSGLSGISHSPGRGRARQRRILRALHLAIDAAADTRQPHNERPCTARPATEFADGRLSHGTLYFADPFGAPDAGITLAEPTPGREIRRPHP